MEKTIFILKVIIPDFFGFQLFSCGTLTNASYIYTFCPEKSPEDYIIINKWIDNMK